MYNISDFGTVMVESGAGGVSRSHGQGMIMNSQGEVATFRIQGLGNMGADGSFRNHGIVFFNANPWRSAYHLLLSECLFYYD